jgi:hypothetical protein
MSQTKVPTAVGGQPVVVVEQSPWRGVINALIWVVLIAFFGIGFGFTSFDLVYVAILAAIIAVPLILSLLFRPKYEFYDSYLLRVSRRGSQQIDYSEIESAEKFRNNVRIELKNQQGVRFGPRGIVIPGDPKLSDGTDLSSWLKAKIPHKATTETPPESNESPDLTGTSSESQL